MPPLVLVVDDSVQVAELVARVLKDAGYRTLIAFDGRSALEIARRDRPDLIVTDVLMPEMNGLDLITEIRSNLVPAPKVIAMSGYPPMEAEALRRGAMDFLHKPLGPEELLTGVAAALERELARPDHATESRQRASQARQEVSTAALGALLAFEKAGVDLKESAIRGARWVVDYFGFGTAAMVAVLPDALEILAYESRSGAESVHVEVAFPFLRDIAETRSAFLIHSTSRYTALASVANAGAIGFIAGVPLLTEADVVLGAIALFDTRPQKLTGDDLLLLEHIGQHATARVEAAVRSETPLATMPFIDEHGIMPGSSFEVFLTTELRLAVREGSAFAVAAAQFEQPWTAPSTRTREEQTPAQRQKTRLAIGHRAPDRLAVFKRCDSAAEAADTARELLDVHRAAAPASWGTALTIEPQTVALVNGRTVLSMIDAGLVQARRQGQQLADVELRLRP